MTNIIDAIKSLDSNSQVSVSNDNINKIIWHDGNPNNITNEEILAKQAELIAEYDAQEYARNRALEYPAIGDQLDMLFHAIDAGKVNKTSDFYKALKAVKDKHPKG